MESLDYWRLCEQLSVSQAALLIIGEDPGDTGEDLSEWEPWRLPKGYRAAISALESAVTTGAIQGTVRRRVTQLWLSRPSNEEHAYSDDGRTQATDEVPIDWAATRLEVASLKRWLIGKGFTKGFFFPTGVPTAEYLDKDDPSYAPKLAAAVLAWEALRADPALIKGRSPKQALIKWLNQHASELELTGEDGRPLTKAVEYIATVANWNMTGGAPKTPSSAETRIAEPDPPF